MNVSGKSSASCCKSVGVGVSENIHNSNKVGRNDNKKLLVLH